VTLEANPGTTDEGRFTAFRELGVNRLSIGVQSFAPRSSSRWGASTRVPTPCAPSRRRAPPGSATFRWTSSTAPSADAGTGGPRRGVRVALGPEHISCYALTLTGLAEDVPMAKALRRGELTLPDDDVVSDMGRCGALGARPRRL